MLNIVNFVEKNYNMNKKIFLSWTIMVLIVLEMVLSMSLAYQEISNSDLCVVGEPKSCASVQDSIYGKIFGIKLPYWALLAFMVLLTLYLTKENLFLAATILGGGMAIYLISVQFFILKQACSTCLLIDGTMVLILIITVVNRFVKK